MFTYLSKRFNPLSFGFQWYPPIRLDFNPTVELGSKSVERQVQLDRERFVLQAIYFSRDSIPFSPEEPEKEEFEAKMATEIPLEDVCFLGGVFPLKFLLPSISSIFLSNKISQLFIVSVCVFLLMELAYHNCDILFVSYRKETLLKALK